MFIGSPSGRGSIVGVPRLLVILLLLSYKLIDLALFLSSSTPCRNIGFRCNLRSFRSFSTLSVLFHVCLHFFWEAFLKEFNLLVHQAREFEMLVEHVEASFNKSQFGALDLGMGMCRVRDWVLVPCAVANEGWTFDFFHWSYLPPLGHFGFSIIKCLWINAHQPGGVTEVMDCADIETGVIRHSLSLLRAFCWCVGGLIGENHLLIEPLRVRF